MGSLTRDNNHVPVLGGVYDDGSGTIAPVQINASNGRVKCTAIMVGGSGTVNSVTDGSTTVSNPSQISFTGATVSNVGGVAHVAITAGGTGTVTDVSVVTANGVSGSVATSNSTPAITLTLGAITPSTVNGNTLTTGTGTITITGTKTLTVADTASVSGTNTGDGAANSSSTYIGTTSVALNRSSAALTLAGITLTTPDIGTPSAGVGTNITGITAAHVVAGTFGTGAYTMDTSLTVPQIFNTDHAITASGNAATVTRAYRNNVVTNNSAATITITMDTTGATGGDMVVVQVLPSSAAAQTITWVNTENSLATAPILTNATTTNPVSVGFKWNALTTKWKCLASA